jgi:hypothetical protein
LDRAAPNIANVRFGNNFMGLSSVACACGARIVTLAERMLILAGPGLLGGLTSGGWLQILRDNGWRVSPAYLPRFLAVSAYSLANSAIARMERRRFGAKVLDLEMPAPLFVLGHWRQGTTHLHNLLTQDTRFAFSTTYEACFPHTFLTMEAIATRCFGFMLPARRPMDDMEWSLSSPQEDEFALALLSRCSPYLAWAFPRAKERYAQHLTFERAPAEDLARWQAALDWYVRKLTFRHGRPLVLKSPPHTARIRLLLARFPDARFVHIRRDPFTVFLSTRRTILANLRLHRLQSDPWPDLDDWILAQYREMYDAYFSQRALVPTGRLVEVSFEDLERSPLAVVREVYKTLSLPEFDSVEPALQVYVASLAHYRKNIHPPLDPSLRRRIAESWRPCFEEWGYAAS